MQKNLKIALKAGQRLCINGAVLKADRRVRLELVNDAAFLLEQHIMAPSEATSPLRRLYCAVQAILMGEAGADAMGAITRQLGELRSATGRGSELAAGLDRIGSHVAAGLLYQALREIRRLLPREPELGLSAP